MGRTSRERTSRGFHTLELVIAMVVVAVLSGIAAIGYAAVTEHSRRLATEAQVADVASAVLSQRAVAGEHGVLTRARLTSALEDLFDGLRTGQAQWTLVPGTQAPADPTELSVTFENAGVPDANQGERMVLTAATSDGHVVAVVVDVRGTDQSLGTAVRTCSASTPALGADAVLAVSATTAVCPS